MGVSVGVLVLLMVSYMWYCILTAVPICKTIDFGLPSRLVEVADARRLERPANEPVKLVNEPAREERPILPRGRVYSSSEP